MPVQKSRKTPSRRGMHRSHDGLAKPALSTDPQSGETHLRHRITPDGSVTILHSFADGSIGADGANPYAALARSADGTLFFGTTSAGGATRTGNRPGNVVYVLSS